MPESNATMLPANVRPVSYDITLEPNLEDFTFSGSETVQVEVLEPTSEITLNCVEIDVASCTVTTSDGAETAAQQITYDEDVETATFRFGTPLPAGPATLSVEFTGELNDRLRGFYRSTYTDEAGNERRMATTQFEATDARRAFPCWDEPALKATFEVTLVVPSDLAAVSNMQEVEIADVRPGVKSVRFAASPVMSTYLLAFIVGDLASIEQTAPNGTLVRIWATRGTEEHGRFALDTSLRLLTYFNDYFGIPYPLQKLDHIAIPDFAAGAMENWGAITYRETALLVDPDNSSASTRQTVAAIIAHEMAHMWFGDLVTMEWWNDLWLNESFASWMGDKAIDALFPEWEMWTQFVTADTNRALNLDGLKTSHPIEQEVKNPAEIGQLFDAISYSKGASILRMLEHFLREEPFRSGLHQYLTDHQYSNARTQDLWDALGVASGQPVTAIMDSWVKQTGYPVIDARISRGDAGTEVSLAQRRFLYEDILGQAEPDGTLWRVPVGVRTAGDGSASTTVMDGREAVVGLPALSDDDWVKVNPLQTGFYRVRYDSDDLKRLGAPIQSKALPAPDRLGTQNDAFALCRAGIISATEFLTVAEHYSDETDASVLADLTANLGGLDNLLGSEAFYSAFQGYARNILRPVGAKVGWDARPGEGHLDALLRSTALYGLGEYEDQDTLREAGTRFNRYANDSSSVNPDIRGVVCSLAAKAGNRGIYDAMWELQRNATLQEERVRLHLALSQFRQAELVDETLRRSLGDEVRVHEATTILASVASNSSGRNLAWGFLKDNWDEYNRRYGDGGFALMRVVSIASGFTTREQREDVERFFRDHPAPAADRTVQQSLERIQNNVAWLDRNRDELSRWFVS